MEKLLKTVGILLVVTFIIVIVIINLSNKDNIKYNNPISSSRYYN